MALSRHVIVTTRSFTSDDRQEVISCLPAVRYKPVTDGIKCASRFYRAFTEFPGGANQRGGEEMKRLTLGAVLMLISGMVIAQFTPEALMRNGFPSTNPSIPDPFKRTFVPSDFTKREPLQNNRSIYIRPGTSRPDFHPPVTKNGWPVVFSQGSINRLLGPKGRDIVQGIKNTWDIYKNVQFGNFTFSTENMVKRAGPVVTFRKGW